MFGRGKPKPGDGETILARFNGLILTETALIEVEGKTETRHELTGLTARVEEAGDVTSRFTATRLVALGPLALAAKKTKDTRTLYVTVEGPNTAIVREISLKHYGNLLMTNARKFVAAVNLAGRQAAQQT